MAHPHQTVTWHTDILSRATRRALDFLSEQQWLKQSKWYLAGGTGLALSAGHRQSLDLDFFTPQSAFSAARLNKRFPQESWKVSVMREGTIYGELLGVKVSFIAYPFFRSEEKPRRYGSVRVLDPRDIAVMKIVAISQRGTKRDFIDLYWYVKNQEPLCDVLLRLPAQYPTVAYDFHHILKSLVYFADAEADPMPRIFFDAQWNQIKKFFKKEIAAAARKLLGID